MADMSEDKINELCDLLIDLKPWASESERKQAINDLTDMALREARQGKQEPVAIVSEHGVTWLVEAVQVGTKLYEQQRPTYADGLREAAAYFEAVGVARWETSEVIQAILALIPKEGA